VAPNASGIDAAPWSVPAEEVAKRLGVTTDRGLRPEEIVQRLNRYGRNQLTETESKNPLVILADQFKSLIVLLLSVAALVSIAFGEIPEGIAIIIVIIINSTIGFITELRAVRSMEALRSLGQVSTRVRRNGEIAEVPAECLVPGDIVVVEGGDIVTADARVATSSKLQADESALTGESLPVAKESESLPVDTLLAERCNMLYKGTAITRGSGEGVVVATGMSTELGVISSLVEKAEDETTPLEKRLDLLGRRLIWATLIVVAVVAVGGILSGREALLMIQTSIALAVATVPEGLPIVATIALARGMLRMARRNALVNQLSAVETLGSTTVICTDKTGTLTENKLSVGALITGSGRINLCSESVAGSWFESSGNIIEIDDNPLLREALEISVLCNNASLKPEDLEGKEGVGDPLEVALLAAGAKAGIMRGDLVEAKNLRKVGEEAFDSEVKMMATVHTQGVVFRVAVKGAPEMVLKACTKIRTDAGTLPLQENDLQTLMERNEEMGAEGFRVLALATKTVRHIDSMPYEDLVFVALIGLRDPPRRGVRQSIESCLKAGIKVIMATGDQAVTAGKVAYEVGVVNEEFPRVISGGDLRQPEDLSDSEREDLLEARIFARVTPKQKLDLIALHQEDGQIVAMTGDGVNDAPALKKADIGVAMGIRGTQVAREASDMVLKDDSFSSIV
jgi:Ca2+-transporting ATPase